MGLLPFCFASLFFFLTPSALCMRVAKKRQLIFIMVLINLALLAYACWFFPQINRQALAFSNQLFDIYCYLVLLTGIMVSISVKAIELKQLLLIPIVMLGLAAVNGIAYLYAMPTLSLL